MLMNSDDVEFVRRCGCETITGGMLAMGRAYGSSTRWYRLLLGGPRAVTLPLPAVCSRFDSGLALVAPKLACCSCPRWEGGARSASCSRPTTLGDAGNKSESSTSGRDRFVSWIAAEGEAMYCEGDASGSCCWASALPIAFDLDGDVRLDRCGLVRLDAWREACWEDGIWGAGMAWLRLGRRESCGGLAKEPWRVSVGISFCEPCRCSSAVGASERTPNELERDTEGRAVWEPLDTDDEDEDAAAAASAFAASAGESQYLAFSASIIFLRSISLCRSTPVRAVAKP